ncbi:MAG: hemolysin family protein [Treponema sp.]|nr:hemolysin family protein [Treponema sp.]
MSAGGFIKSLFKKDGELDTKAIKSLETDHKEIIQSVVELRLTAVREVMIPRIDTVFVAADDSQEDLLSTIIDSDYSRFPVYEETIDNVIGILYIKDVLKSLVQDNTIDVRKIARKPFFVPETKRIDELLREMRRRKVQIAVLVDEYGGVSGIVTMEDILEEIIGDIQDEFDNEKEDIVELGDGVWLCDTRVNLEDLSTRIDVELPFKDFDTLGGFVFDLFGKIPVKHEKAAWNSHDFIIQDVEGHKINSVKIILSKKEE